MKSKKLLSLILSIMMVLSAVSAIPFSANATSKPQGWVKTAVEDIEGLSTVMVTMDTDGDGKGDWVLPNAEAQTPEATAFSKDLSKDDYGFNFVVWQGKYSFASTAVSGYAAITSDSNTGFEVKSMEITDFDYTTINGHNYFIDHDTNHSLGNTDRCFGVYVPAEGTPTWRCYKSTNLSNIANQDVVLYVWGDLPEAVEYEKYYVLNGVLTHETLSTDEYTVVTSNTKTLTSGTYVVNSQVTDENQIRVADGAEVKLILCEGSSLTAKKGIICNEGSKLDIYGQEDGDGDLIATASENCAAIGGEYTEETFQHKNGYITIHGGNITATGVDHTPGIGGSNWSSAGMITILNGNITATAGYGAAGIGGSEYGSGGTIEIFGGTVYATGGHENSDGIGKGHFFNGTNYAITMIDGVKLEKSTDGSTWTTSDGSAESRAQFMRSSYTPPAPKAKFTIYYDANGGKKGPMWQDKEVRDNTPITLKFPDITGRDDIVSPPAGKVFDAYSINGKRYEVGETYKVTTNTIELKILWKNAPDSITAAEKRKARNAINASNKASVNKDGSITIKWGKYKKAEKIVVYAAYCSKTNKFKKIKTLKGSATSYTISKLNGKKLNQKKDIKAYVVAYRKVDGKYKKLAKSYQLHIAGKKNTKSSNAKAIKVKKDSFTINVKKSATIKPTLVLEKKGKKAVAHVTKFRYLSTNPSIASVDKSGKITGKKKGNCEVYIFANNGMLKTVSVTVE